MKPTVIESARKAAGMSQARLARLARTQQSSISEYESRRKSPTLDVVERLVDAADHELAVRPIVFFEERENPDGGRFWVPERLWSVPMPDCFARVQVLKYILRTDEHQIWDLSDSGQRIDFYELVLVRGIPDTMLDSVDGHLLVQVWSDLNLPDVVREAWQPLIDGYGTAPVRSPRDPGGLSARIAGEIGLQWPPPQRSRRRPR